MRIAASGVSLAAQAEAISVRTREEEVRFWAARPRPQPAAGTGAKSQPAEETAETRAKVPEISPADRLKMLLVKKLLEALTGKKVRFLVPGEELEGEEKKGAACPGASAASPSATAGRPAGGPGWGMEIRLRETVYERERLAFRAEGVIRTGDGREIQIGVDFRVSYEFAARLDLTVRLGEALTDPLVICFDGRPPALEGETLAFDLDADGATDRMPRLAPGSGLLALDGDGDGTVSNGGELFGPRSGNGYADLAAYDANGNGWIDEADPVFTRLRVWSWDGTGEARLLALGEVGVGAIHLAYAAGALSLRDGENQVQGVIRRTGIFLREDGTAGTTHCLDLKA